MANREVTRDDYQRASGDYESYLFRARRRFEAGEAASIRQVRQVYQRAAQRIRDELRTVTRGTLKERHMLAVAKALVRQADVLRGELDSVLRSGIQMSVKLAMDPAQAIALDTMGDVFDRTGIRAMFTNVNQRAIAALLARTRSEDGLRVSERIWRTSQRWRQVANRVIEDTVASGLDSRKAAREVDQYLQPQTHTAFKAETRRRLGVPKDVSYEAMRLTVSEMNNAFHEGTVLANRAIPSYDGILWRLSHSHPVRDICDEYAEHNGNGFWPKGEEPSKPHPWCKCHSIPFHEDTADFAIRLKEWLNDPNSQPDLESWYNDTAKPFLSKPVFHFMGGIGGSRKESAYVRLAQEHGISQDAAESIERIGADLRQRTLDRGIEFAAMVDVRTGETLGRILDGEKSSVVLKEHIDQMDPNKNYVQIHTHPRSSSFSDMDVMLLHHNEGLHAMAVFGADGRSYLISKQLQDVIDDVYEIREAYEKERDALFPKYQQEVSAGNMTQDEAWKEHSHEIWVNIAERLGFKYSRLKE